MSVARSQLTGRARRSERHLSALPSGPTVALTYGRMSKAEKATEGPSIPHQYAICEEYIARHDGWVIAERFDDGMSGRRDDRDGYQRMLATVRSLVMEGKHVAVVIRHLDRLGRNLKERVRAWEELHELGAEIHAVADGGHQRSELTYNILASTAQEEARLASERIISANDRFEVDGWHRPAGTAWGYRLRPPTPEERLQHAPKAVLDLDDETAPYVREMWQRAAGGASSRALASWAAGLPEAARGGRVMRYETIRYLLRATVYVGRFGPAHNVKRCVAETEAGEAYGERCPVLGLPVGRWPALVTDDEWQAVHDHYRRTVVMPRSGRPPKRADAEPYLLTGILKCHKCGLRMRGNTAPATVSKDRGVLRMRQERRRYVCSGRAAGATTTSCSACVTAGAVEEPLLASLSEMLAALDDERLLAGLKRAYQAQLRAETGPDDTPRLIAAQQAAISKASASLTALTEKYIDPEGGITRMAYAATSDALQAKIQAAQAELARLSGRAGGRREVPPLDAVLCGVGGWAHALEAGAAEVRRQALADLVEWVRPVPVARGRYEVSLKLTPTGQVLLDAALGVRASANLVSIKERASSNYWIDTQHEAAS